jgi:cell division initiation protein
MKLTPLLIKKQEFTKSLRGFNVEEVQSFLDQLSNEFEDLIRENESLKEEIENLSQQVIEFQKIEKNLQETLERAQESSARTMESTKRQTEFMVKEAEIKASQMMENARDDANQIRSSVITLREEKDLIVAKLKAIVATQSHLLEGKLKDAGEEQTKPKQTESTEKVDIDVDDIVNKIL